MKADDTDKMTLQENHEFLPSKKPCQLKRLNARHKKAIYLHLQGCKLDEISEKTGLTPWWISRILNSDLAQQEIVKHHEFFDLEFKSLYARSIETIREGLRHPDINVRLKAADKYFKAHGKYLKRCMRDETTEDVIQRIEALLNLKEK
ncbi:MAG: hypothetical protein ACYTEL_00560 [Planctomycetota bacterium]|jgi:hypothetical protein